MLPCVCSVIDHRWRQNVVKTKNWNTRRSQVCHWCSYHILTSNWKLSQRIGRKESVVYQATVSTEDHNPPQIYVGLTENCFKTRYSNHKFSFSNVSKRHNTELSKYIWYLVKGNFTKFQVTWRILKHASSYNPTSLRCNLCLWEKYFIICRPDLSLVSISLYLSYLSCLSYEKNS